MASQLLTVEQESLSLKKKNTDEEGCILILDVSSNDSVYILINLYKANTENMQIDVLSSWLKLLEEFDTNPTKQVVMDRNFNLFFDSKLEAQVWNPTIKKEIIS